MTPENVHFYLDNAPPKEVVPVLRVLTRFEGLTPKEIAEAVQRDYGFAMQRDVTYSPRRLADLKLAEMKKKANRTEYILTDRGEKVQHLIATNSNLIPDILHFLHYNGFAEQPKDAKYLWSYRHACEWIWQHGMVFKNGEIARFINDEMIRLLPHLQANAREGWRFDETAAGRLRAWLNALEPSPLPERGSGPLIPRRVEEPALALLALTDTYAARKHAFGDAIILTDEIRHQTAGVFFLDPALVPDLLQTGARLYPDMLRLGDTLAGMSVCLSRPFTLENDL